jgi:hypothetical protein
MSGSIVALIVIPIVIAVCLVVWIGMVFHASRHPEPGRGGAPDRAVTGGIFRGDPRQWSPRRDAPAEQPEEAGGGSRPEEAAARDEDRRGVSDQAGRGRSAGRR